MGVVVAVVVVGVCIYVGSRLALGGRPDEVATAPAAAPRARRSPSPRVAPPALGRPVRGELTGPTRWWVRARSAVGLAVLSTALGVAAAVGIGLVLVVLLGLLRASVG